MLMDIACPVELIRAEQTSFGGDCHVAYLTFLNESDRPIVTVSGRMTLRGENGQILDHLQVAFDSLTADPGETFTCHLTMDDYPPFASAEVSLEYVAFDAGEHWALHPRRLMDCTPPPLPQGPERVALVALAGHDAVCFPERRDTLWVCLCGRYNRWRWLSCRRCKRERDETLAVFTPQQVLSDYQEAVETLRAQDQERLVARAEETHTKKKQVAAQKEHRKRIALRERRFIALAATVLVVSLLIWGLLKLLGPSTGEQMPQATQATPIDYLETL